MEEKIKNEQKQELAKATESSSKKSTADTDKKLIAIIRIAGLVKVKREIAETLYRLKLRRKYSCVVVKPTKPILGMIEKVKHYVSYGEIDKETLVKLLMKRGQKIEKDKKMHAKEIINALFSVKDLKELGLKPFFRLHPPRGGIKSKLQYPKGVLGKNKDINKLIERML